MFDNGGGRNGSQETSKSKNQIFNLRIMILFICAFIIAAVGAAAYAMYTLSKFDSWDNNGESW